MELLMGGGGHKWEKGRKREGRRDRAHLHQVKEAFQQL